MTISYAQTTINEYLQRLSAKEPVPGGGSAAALSGAMGTALIQMVAHYSIGKGKSEDVEKELQLILRKSSEKQQRLMDLITIDSQAFLSMKEAKKEGEASYKKACLYAAQVPAEIKCLCQEALCLTDFLHQEGNKYLLSDVIAAQAFLKAGILAASAMIEANQ